MSNALGQQIIVEKAAGAGGVIGSNRVARAAPDGYTLIVSGSGTHAAAEHLRKDLPYRSTDFEQIGLINTSAAAPLMETVPQLRKPAILQPALEQPRPRLCPSRPLWRPLMIGRCGHTGRPKTLRRSRNNDDYRRPRFRRHHRAAWLAGTDQNQGRSACFHQGGTSVPLTNRLCRFAFA